jgi:hypothetical protein
MITIELVSNALFKLDPMDLCCVENDVFHEYDPEAKKLVSLLHEDLTIDQFIQIVKQVFDEYFWENCRPPEKIEEIAMEIFRLYRNPAS